MSLSPTHFIDVNVAIQAAGLSTANFGSAMLFIPQSDLTEEAQTGWAVDTYRTFSDISSLSEYLAKDEEGNECETYTVASVWLGGTPTVKDLKVYVRNPEDSSWATTLDKARNLVWWYFTLATKPVYESATDVKQIAAWCETNASFFPNCQTGDNATAIRNETLDTDIATALTTSGYRHTATASHASDAYSLIYLMKHFARVNYSATNSTITGEFKKSTGLDAEDLSATEYAAMEKDTKKCAYYTAIELQGSTDSGRWKNTWTHSTYGEWIDDVINLDAFTNAITVAIYNCIANQTTKLPQTPVGQAVVIAAAKKVCEQYITNGYLGERTYTDPDDAEEKTSRGYEILTTPDDILDISDSDRNKRLCAPIRIRLFRAGAIHAVSLNVDVY